MSAAKCFKYHKYKPAFCSLYQINFLINYKGFNTIHQVLRGQGGVFKFEILKLNLTTFLIEKIDSYQMLCTKSKNIVFIPCYSILKHGKYILYLPRS